MIRLAYSVFVLIVLGATLFGAVVCTAFAVQYFGSFGGLTGFAAFTLYVVAVGLPVVIGLHLLGLNIK